MNIHLKRILYFFFIAVGISVIGVLIGGAAVPGILRMFSEYWYWIIMAIVSLLGFGFGWIGHELNLRRLKNKNRIFIVGHCIGLGLFLLLIGSTVYDSYAENRNVNSIENQRIMNTWVNPGEEYIKIAFDRLESEFNSPNDFILTSFSVRTRDTTVNGLPDTIYKIYFTYHLKKEEETKGLSKVEVFNNKAILMLHNFDETSIEEFVQIIKDSDKNAATFDSVLEMIKNLPDTFEHKQIFEILKNFRRRN